MWVMSLQISVVPLCLPSLCCCCVKRPCVWAEPTHEGSDTAVLEQCSQIVSQRWPTGAGLMDVLVRALQLTAAAHPSLWFLYPWCVWSSWWRCREKSCRFAFLSSIVTDWGHTHQEDWKLSTLSVLSFSCLHFSDGHSRCCQHSSLSPFLGILLIKEEKRIVESLGQGHMKKSQRSTIQTASNQRIAKTQHWLFKSWTSKSHIWGGKHFFFHCVEWGKSREKKKDLWRRWWLPAVYRWVICWRGVVGSLRQSGCTLLLSCICFKETFFNSLVFSHSLLFAACQRVSWRAVGLSVYRWKMSGEPGAAAPLRNKVR